MIFIWLQISQIKISFDRHGYWRNNRQHYDVRLSSWNLERILTNWYSRSCGYLLNGIVTKLYRKWSIKRTQREIVYLVKESHKEHKTVLLQMVSVSSIIEMLQTLNRRGKDWWGNWCHHFFLKWKRCYFSLL